ncbi:DUF6624 domain-containing protein [Streptomyces sp. NPDC055078]
MAGQAVPGPASSSVAGTGVWWPRPYAVDDTSLPPPDAGAEGAARPDLALDLVRRAGAVADQRAIDDLFPDGEPVHRLLTEANTRVLHRIVAVHGWPGYRLVGPVGAEAALLIALDCEPVFFLRTLARLLHDAVRAGDAPAQHTALLADRIRVRQGCPQRYGTHVRTYPDGSHEVWPVDDVDLLPARRAEAGLPPLPEALLDTFRQRPAGDEH